MTPVKSIPQRLSPIVGRLATIAVVVAGVAASATAYTAEARAAQHERDERVTLVINNATTQMQALVTRHVETAWAAADFLSAHPEPSREQFVAFSEGLRDHVEGILGVGYVRRVAAADAESFVAAARADGAPGFAIDPFSAPEAAVILYNEPASDLRTSWGADLRQVDAASAALDVATESGRPALTDRVTLAVDRALPADERPAGYVIYVPVFDPSLPAGTPAERRAAVVGWANVPFRARDLLARIDAPEEVALRLVDEDGAGTALTAPGDDSTARRAPIEVLGSSWTLEVIPADAFLDNVRDYSVAAGLLGLGSTAVIAVLVLLVATGSRRWERAARRATASLIESEQRLRATVASAPDLILVTGGDGTIIDVSERSSDLLLRRPETLVGSSLEEAFPGASLNGHPLELALRRADGTSVPVELRHARLRAEDPTAGNVIVLRDITDRVRADEEAARVQEALAAYARELERSNSDLEELAEVAAHDLSEPARVVAAYASLLREQYREERESDREALQFLGAISRSVDRMLSSIDGVLEVSRVRGEIGEFRNVDFADVVRDATANLELVIRDSGAKVEVGPLPVVWGDRIMLARVVQNLMANAIRFSHPDRVPRVTITAEPEGGYWAIHVTDNGVGIPSSERKRIFVMFRRAHDSRDGSGIGLAVCRRIVDLHGGDIAVTSTEGLGSTFTFRLVAGHEA